MSSRYNALWRLLCVRKITKKELKEKANLTQYQINKLNQGEIVSIDVMLKICKSLNVSIYAITNDENIILQYRNHNKKSMVFPLIVQGDENLKYVFPSKQSDVLKAISLAKLDERINRLIVFGSAVTMRCGINSDIDIAIDAPDVGEDDFEKIARSFYLGIDSEVDVVHYNAIHNNLLKQEIDDKGVDIYVKR